MTESDRKPAFVFDVNVLIDAVDARDPNSRRHEHALSAVAMATHSTTFTSDRIIGTLRHKLLELDADPDVVEEYIDLLTDDEFGVDFKELADLDVLDYGIRDAHGLHDHEDNTVVATVDAVDERTPYVGVLVCFDQPLTRWALEHGRPALSPERFINTMRIPRDVHQESILGYVAGHMFGATRRRTPTSHEIHRTQEHAVSTRLAGQRRQPQRSTAAEIHRRYPELDPRNRLEREGPLIAPDQRQL